MPTPKKYASAAEKQAAYRQRLATQPHPKPVSSIPGYRRWNVMKSQSLSAMETMIDEMESYYDQRSESWQNSERGEAFAEVIESMSDIAASLRDIDF